MGAGNSRPTSGPSVHTFEATGARTSFAGELVGSLEGSTQSDSTRASSLEHKIQERVTHELQRLADEESTRLAELLDSASPPDNDDNSGGEGASDPTLLDKLTGSADAKRKQQLSRESVSAEIAALRRKLEERRTLERPDAGVEKAKEQLVACLRLNDRRPLDCWREREEFKRQVSRLETEFVRKTVR